MSEKRDERLRFAEDLMEEAEHSSEIAIRTSLSRAYYAVHHLGIEVTGASDHGEIRNRLRARDERLGSEYGYFLERRSRADYSPSLSKLEPGGVEQLRDTFRDDIVRARLLLERLKREL